MAGGVLLGGVSKYFGATQALDNVSVEFESGQVNTLLGENGSGKSTLIKILAGAVQPTAGSVSLEGKLLALGSPREAVRSGIAAVYQEISVLPNLTVAENIFLEHYPKTWQRTLDVRSLNERTEVLWRELEFPPLGADRRCGELSVAQLQLVEIARAMARHPKVILFDEATSALDRDVADTVMKLCRRVAKDGMVVVFVSHRLDEVMNVSDTVTVLRDGKLALRGQAHELSRDRLLAAMLGEAAAEGDTAHRQSDGLARHAPVADVAIPACKWLGQPLSFQVRPGEVLGLAGLQGHGPKSVLRILGGDMPQPGMEVKLGGRTVRIGSPHSAIRAGIYYIPEERKVEGILSGHSVAANLALSSLARITRWGLLSTGAERGRAEQMRTDLSIRMGNSRDSIDSLSGGNQQKVILGRGILATPKVFLLDDATRGIDLGAKRDIYRLLESLSAKGVAVIMNSTELSEFPRLCDRVLVFYRGAVVTELTGLEITEDRIIAAMFGIRKEGTAA